MTNQQLAETCRDILAEADKQALISDCKRDIKRVERLLGEWANSSLSKAEYERHLKILQLALAALTQPASPALKLPDCPFPCGWKELLRLAMRDGAFLARDLIEGDPVTEFHRRSALTNTDRLIQVVTSMIAAPHTAHIEPSCATGRTMPGSEFNELVGKLAARNYGTSADIANVLCDFNIKPERQ